MALRERVRVAVRLRVGLLVRVLEVDPLEARLEEEGTTANDAKFDGVLLGRHEALVVILADIVGLAEAGREALADIIWLAEAGCEAGAERGGDLLTDGDAEDEDEEEPEEVPELELLEVSVREEVVDVVGVDTAEGVADCAGAAGRDGVKAALPVRE